MGKLPEGIDPLLVLEVLLGRKNGPEELVMALADAKLNADAHRGEAIFRRQELQCSKCHAIAGAGGRVGPDLISVGASAQVDYLVESLRSTMWAGRETSPQPRNLCLTIGVLILLDFTKSVC